MYCITEQLIEHNKNPLKTHHIDHQVVLPITKGKLDLGPWEQVFYAEFDEKKCVVVKILGILKRG